MADGYTSQMMKAAVYHGPGDVRVEEIPVPEVGAGEMLVRVLACGICGTDVKKIQKGLLPGPRVFGHEIAGTVARVGRSVVRYQEGDRVALYHHIPCGTCFYCQHARHAQCPLYKRNGTTAGFEAAGGGFAEYVKAMEWIVERGAIPIPEGVLALEAAFVEPVNTCLKAVRKAEISEAHTVLIVGQGPIGLLLLQLVKRRGARVLVSDRLRERLEVSARLGADVTLAAETDVVTRVRDASLGRGADRTLLAALGQEAFEQAIAATRPGGRIMVFAATSKGENVQLDLGALCADEKEIFTSYSASVDVQDEAARLVFTREIRVRELVSHILPLEDAARALELASRAEPGVLKVMLAKLQPNEVREP